MSFPNTNFQTGTVITSDWLNAVNEKCTETVSVKDFGAVGDGVTDDTAAIQAALDSLTNGGTVFISNEMKCLIDNNLTIPNNCSLIGPHKIVGSALGNGYTNYGTIGGTLILNSTKSITIKGSASISGFLIYRKGMTFPATDASDFAGTAIRSSNGGDDIYISNLMILGFARAILSSGTQRPKIEYVNIDCHTGIEVIASYDLTYISNCHCWPFSTVANGNGSANVRNGTAYYLHDVVDWGKVTNCFSYGYQKGFHLKNVGVVTLIGCSSDNVTGNALVANAAGLYMENAVRGFVTDFQTAGSGKYGIYLNNTNSEMPVMINGLHNWGESQYGIFVESGDLRVSNGLLRNNQYGIYINNASSQLFADKITYISPTVAPIYTNNVNTNLYLGFDTSYTDYSGDIVQPRANAFPSIASSTSVSIPKAGNFFVITGTTSFGAITPATSYPGRIVTLLFKGVLTVIHNTTNPFNIRLKNNTNFTTAVNSTLTIMFDGNQWFEIGRAE